ncbi:MAG: hypothetical protein MUE40_09770 [Anaerolineae bacterium]|nr:hypothetical protein [Anaerolineae bacterium]
MADTRLTKILTTLARQHVPHWLAGPPLDDARQRLLAAELAKEGKLVIMGLLPERYQTSREAHINAWVSTYGTLYIRLTEVLFPSLTQFGAVYADTLQPPVIVLEGAGGVVLRAFAGYIVPYIAVRQPVGVISQPELHGVMTMLLTDLEADDLPGARYDRLLNEGVALLHSLLESRVQTIALTDFARPLFQQLRPPAPTPPPDIPEAEKLEQLKTREMFVSPVPIFFKPPPAKSDRSGKKPRPPVLPPGWKPDPS